MATLCGAKNCVDIADLTAANEGSLAEIVDLPHGAPSHDSFSRLFRLLDPDEMSKAFAAFTAALRDALVSARWRRGRRRRQTLAARIRARRQIHAALMISVWDAQTRLSIAARASKDKNEVKATLDALKSLDLKGCIVTADRCIVTENGRRRARARRTLRIETQGNNGPLHARAVAAFEKADARGDGSFHEKSESGHDRFERRRPALSRRPRPRISPSRCVWTHRERAPQGGGETTTMVHYVALSKRLSPRRLLETVRLHWSVENNCHWPLDVVFHEDDARARKNHAHKISRSSAASLSTY